MRSSPETVRSSPSPVRFSTPHNWCDRRCERCPLAAECPVNLSVSRRQFEAVTRGQDPHDPAVVMAHVGDSFRESIELLTRIAEDEGISLEDLEPPPPPPPEATALTALARAYALVVHGAVGDADLEDAGEAVANAFLLYAKVGRIACSLPEPETSDDDDVWRYDTMPNLMLIERVDAELHARLFALTERLPFDLAPLLAARAALTQALAPFLARVTSDARAELEDLRATHRAPSPHCTTTVPRARA